MQKDKIAIRIDDVFACTKEYEIFGKENFKIGSKYIPISILSNFLFMKYAPGFKKRLPYREINTSEWKDIFRIAEQNNIKFTVAITANWVKKDCTLIPFFKKFPKEAEVLKEGLQYGLIEIANHGFTHCVVGQHMPRLFISNRKYHREFWNWIPVNVHRQHIMGSQELLSQYFGCQIVTFVPPGNVWTKDTERFAFEYGIRYLSSTESSSPTGTKSNGLTYLGDKYIVAIHDRDIVLNGLSWLEKLIRENSDKEIITIRELGELYSGVREYS